MPARAATSRLQDSRCHHPSRRHLRLNTFARTTVTRPEERARRQRVPIETQAPVPPIAPLPERAHMELSKPDYLKPFHDPQRRTSPPS